MPNLFVKTKVRIAIGWVSMLQPKFWTWIGLIPKYKYYMKECDLNSQNVDGLILPIYQKLGHANFLEYKQMNVKIYGLTHMLERSIFDIANLPTNLDAPIF